MPFFFFSGSWYASLIIILPGVLLALYAQWRVKHAFAKYREVRSGNNFSGAQAAREILDSEGLSDISIEETPGELTDHYDPRQRVLRLSGEVYHGRSVAALGVAAHEAGHAIQHARKYLPLMARAGIFPVVALGSNLWMPVAILGIVFSAGQATIFFDIAILMLSGVIAFQVITLPVEFNASKRALALLTSKGIITSSEQQPTKTVLNAAALTYLAALLVSILNLVRLLVLRHQRDD